MSKLTVLVIWVVVVGAVFAYAWRKGYLLRLADYVRQTREELKKCTWPTWDELKGSTVLVSLSTILLSLFIFVVNQVFAQLMMWISKV